MLRHTAGILFSTLIISSLAIVHAQEAAHVAANTTENLKTVVVAVAAKSDSEIAVPPATSVTFSTATNKKAGATEAVDLPSWLSKEEALTGLQSDDLRPWHIVVAYDQFDEDGDNINSGVYEEYWFGPKKYKRSYKSDRFNQTDYATEKGLYRSGDQKWPDRAQSQVRSEVVTPFSYGATLHGFHARSVERTFGTYKLQCVLIERDSGISDPAQYCFEPDSSILRYSRGQFWFQTVYNRIVQFQGRNLAQEADVTDGGKRYLKLRVQTIELISGLNDADISQAPDAVGPVGERVSGVNPVPINVSSFPQWPASLRGQHVTVKLDIVIGKDGHVISAEPTAGPPEGYKACENAVRKWVFQPYLVLEKPVEVEQKVECRSN
jgi:hypothetical protein